MEITVDTKIIPLIGKPLRHSLSSRMHTEAIRMGDLDYVRIPMEINKEYLGNVINGLRYMNVAGISITKPYKVEVIQYLDELDELAEKIGAVNCIVNTKGRLKGYNTDGEGFVNALQQYTDYELKKTVFFCFGAGGAGKAICSTLAYRGVKKIYITDQKDLYSDTLVKNINKFFSPIAEQIPFTDILKIRDKIAEADIVMNVTGLGMFPDISKTPIEKEFLKADQLAFDATYNPIKTKFLQDAESVGCKTINGKGMLIHCGMMGFELYTGIKQSIDIWSEIMNKIIIEK